MKHLLITTLMLLSIGSFSPANAQKGRQYDDDVYSSKPSSAQQPEEASQGTTSSNDRQEEPTYSSGGSQERPDDHSAARQYSDEYYDSDDDYYYSSRINRFNYPFYNRPYWSTFYNPYWYDPYWVDPYSGWSSWARPGISISFGVGPYWSSYWGYNSWYGYPGFGSYYSFPSYGYGYGGYYGGYWNGYYAGLYSGDGYSRQHYGRAVTYGPRYTLRPNNAMGVGLSNGGYSGFRRAPAGSNNVNTGAANAESATMRNNGFRTEPGNAVNPSAIREERARAAENRNNVFNNGNEARTNDARTNDTRTMNERPVRNGWNEGDRSVRNSEVAAPTATPSEAPRRERSSWFGSRGEQTQNTAAPAPQRAQRGVWQPRTEQRSSEPAPSRSFGGGRESGGFGGGGGRSSGGGNGGGGSFGGGGGRRR